VEARGRPAATEIFLPYLSGERTPHNDPSAKGVLFGLTHESDAAAFGQAVLEGVAMAFRDGLDVLKATGAELNQITVIGGGARSGYWGRVLASALGRELVYRTDAEVGPALGAARLARLAIGEGTVETVCVAPPIREVVAPEPQLSDHFAARIDRYRALYQALKPSFMETVA
jgi:xylulokinase